eukprot:365602-Chlamydomonas_euryale.AAC.15
MRHEAGLVHVEAAAAVGCLLGAALEVYKQQGRHAGAKQRWPCRGVAAIAQAAAVEAPVGDGGQVWVAPACHIDGQVKPVTSNPA